MSAWTSARDGHVQTSPLLNANSTRPSTALSRNASSWAITSLKKMFGLLPPSSAVTGMMFSAAYCIISLPVVVSPVNPIFAIRGLVASALPIDAPGPVRMLITPAGTASPTPWSILKLMEVIGDAVPAGVINILTGPGASMGKALATSPRIAKIGFTGETTTGKLMMQYAAENIIPVTAELGGKSPNIFFSDVMAHDDAFLDKAVEGLVLFAFNKGEVCTCPSRALVQADIYDAFMERVLVRMKAIKQGNPLDTETMVGPQVSIAQFEKISGYVDIGRGEGCEVLTGGAPATMAAPYDGGYYYQPTILKGENSMRVFQEEIFGPVLALTTFTDEADALRIANDTKYGLGAGVWTRDGNRAYRMGRGIQAGRVWTNCYHNYPAGAAVCSEQTHGLLVVTDQQVLVLAVLLDHHLVVLAADARHLVPAERRSGRVVVVAVGPHPTGLDPAAHPVGAVAVARPHAGAEAVLRVVGDPQRVRLVGERRQCEHRSEDLLLEDPHRVLTLEDRRLVVVPAVVGRRHRGGRSTGQDLAALAAADVNVAGDLLELRDRHLRPDHRLGVEGVALLDRLHAHQDALHERVVDVGLDERPRRARADLALVEREQHEALDGLVQERVVVGHDVAEEDVRALATEFGSDRDDVLGRVLPHQLAGRRLTREPDLRDPRARRERLAHRCAGTRQDVDHTGRDGVADDLHELEDRPRRRRRRPGRCDQHPDGSRRIDGQGARDEPANREDRVHG